MVKIIKNGRVIDPESRFDGRADLWIENGKIQKIVKKDTKSESDEASDAPFIPADAEVLDAEGLIVAPGLVDVHVHFRDPGLTYKEDIETGAAAAKAGGFTTVVCMANTKPVADRLSGIFWKRVRKRESTWKPARQSRRDFKEKN